MLTVITETEFIFVLLFRFQVIYMRIYWVKLLQKHKNLPRKKT